MKYLFTVCLLASLFLTSCVKGDRQNTKYKIEVSSTGTITGVYYTTRDHGPQSVTPNSSAWEYEWKKGYKQNKINVMVECSGSATIKIYRKGDVVEEKSGTTSVNASWEGDSN